MQEKLENILIEKERRLAAFLALDWSFYLLFFATVPTLETKKRTCYVLNVTATVQLAWVFLYCPIDSYLDEQIETKKASERGKLKRNEV